MVTRAEIFRVLADERDALTREVHTSLTSRGGVARAEFLTHFRDAETEVARHVGLALTMLGVFEHRVDAQDRDRLNVMAIAFTSLNLQVTSFKLFMSGHTVASGSLFRQVIEGVSLGFLCSVRRLGFLARFDAGKYSGKDAVKDLKRRAREIHVRESSMNVLSDSYRFYHAYAHLTKLTIAASLDFSGGPNMRVGALFDARKLPEYRKEVRSRVKFARVMPNAVRGICRNLASWP
jgi:hypothetical protein